MAFENYINFGTTTLLGTMLGTSTASTFSVGTPSALPTTAQFRVVIDSEIMLCTALSTTTSTVTYTVTRAAEGSTIGTHAAGATVSNNITAGAMDQIRLDLHQTGSLSSAVANKAGNLYLPNNALTIQRDTGAAFATWGPIWALTNPNLQTWVQQNFGSCTSDTSHGGISIENPTTEGAFNTHALVFNTPVTPYHIEFGYIHQKPGGTNNMAGPCFSDGTKYEIFDPFFQDAYGTMICFYLTNSTTFSSTPINSSNSLTFGSPYVFWCRLGDDGVNKTWDISVDGYIWRNIGSEASATNFTATKAGIYVDCGPSFIRLISLKITG